MKRSLDLEVERALAILTDWEHYPPAERLKAGDFLGAEPGRDPRPGVGLRPDGLPDIDWVEIPEFGPNNQRTFLYHDGTRNMPHDGLPTFWIARYPITYAQFEAFVDASDGYRNPEWRKGLADYFGTHGTRWPQRWALANRPRESVTWPEAVAFSRWLSAKAQRTPDLLPSALRTRKNVSIMLPTEWQWVKAARGFDDRLYPWGGQKYREGYANVDEMEKQDGPHYLQQTSAVGLYPQGASPFGVLDLSGNVWEWCLNKYQEPDDLSLGGTDQRVLRGGSWYYNSVGSSVAARGGGVASISYGVGFRVVCAASP